MSVGVCSIAVHWQSGCVESVCIDSRREETSHLTLWGFLWPALENGSITFAPIHSSSQWTV